MDHPPTGQICTLLYGSHRTSAPMFLLEGNNHFPRHSALHKEDNVNRNFVFRVGELHTVFASFKAIGKYIDESGIDQSSAEADIYGPTTFQQIKERKHMKLDIDAYTTLYLALYKLYFAKLFEKYPEESEHSVKDAMTSQCNVLQS